jgi:predicted DNA-binding transcriptional regulator AlpA
MNDSNDVEILTAEELAQRLKVKRSWVVEAGRTARNSDPLPIVKIGRHNRYGWNSKSMTAWLTRQGLK